MGRSWLLVLAAAAGCTTHAFAQKTPDGKVYLNGTSGFLFFSSSFIKRCTESGTTLTCERLTIVDVATDKAGDEEPKPKPKKKRKPASEDSDGDDSGDQPRKPKKPASDDE